MSEHVFERFLRMPFKRAYVVGPCLGYRHWMEFQPSFLWWWGNLEDGSHKLMKLEQRHKWNLGSYDGDSPGLLVSEPHDIIYEKTNPRFAKALFAWVSSPFQQGQTFRAEWVLTMTYKGPIWRSPSPFYIFLTLSPITLSCIYYIPAAWPLHYVYQVHSNLQGFALAAPPTWSPTALNVCPASSFPSSRLLLKIPFPVLLP